MYRNALLKYICVSSINVYLFHMFGVKYIYLQMEMNQIVLEVQIWHIFGQLNNLLNMMTVNTQKSRDTSNILLNALT